MSMIDSATRLQRHVPVAEARIDDALIAVSSLMASIVTARRETGVPAKTGQATIQRLAKAQMSLILASSDVLRVHGELVQIGRETGGLDVHEDCPDTPRAAVPHLAAVA